jgi:hypothetical protein
MSNTVAGITGCVVRTASKLVLDPVRSVTTTVYAPALAGVGFVTVQADAVAPGIVTPLKRHW